MAPLLFLPGAGGAASFWRPVADRLADLGASHVVGYPGFGDRPANPSILSLDDLFAWLVQQLPVEPGHVIAQSMGGILAVRMALERPELVSRLVLVATSGGVDVARLGGADWRQDYRASRPAVPSWFVDDRTDLADRLGDIRASTLLLWSDADPISPLPVAHFLAGRIPGSRLVTVASGTHAFASERPDEVASIIRSHLTQDALAGSGGTARS
jgi:pimeloyl-ACP methyl ester carboxylesterase